MALTPRELREVGPSELSVEISQFALAVAFCYGGLTLVYYSGIDPRGTLRKVLFLPLLVLAYPSGRLLARVITRARWRRKGRGAA